MNTEWSMRRKIGNAAAQRFSARTTQPEHRWYQGMNESSVLQNRTITSYGRMVEPSNTVNKPIRVGRIVPHS